MKRIDRVAGGRVANCGLRELGWLALHGLGAGLVASAVLALAVFIISFEAHAAANTAAEHGALMLHDANGEPFDAPLLFTDVHMDVTGMLARVQVRQRFASPSREWMEGVYGFALPEKAAVDHMTMTSASRQTFSISETARRRRHADRRNT